MGWVAKGTMTLAILPETGRQNITHLSGFMDGVNGVLILRWLGWLPTRSKLPRDHDRSEKSRPGMGGDGEAP